MVVLIIIFRLKRAVQTMEQMEYMGNFNFQNILQNCGLQK